VLDQRANWQCLDGTGYSSPSLQCRFPLTSCGWGSDERRIPLRLNRTRLLWTRFPPVENGAPSTTAFSNSRTRKKRTWVRDDYGNSKLVLQPVLPLVKLIRPDVASDKGRLLPHDPPKPF
jgi:hypothetical protein